MKYIKLFENFDLVNENNGSINGLVFDFLPFDDQINNPSISSIPSEVTYEELKEMKDSGITKMGLYIAHKKLNTGGFIRIIADSLDPLTFDVATFGSDFNKISDHVKIDGENFDLGSYITGSSIMNRFR